MKIFVADNAFDIEVIFIRGGIGTRQHVFGVKDVKTFILHRAHVEEIDSNNHIDVEVIFETKARFIPLHGVDERGHCPRCAVKVATIHEQLQRDFTARARFKGVAENIEISRHQRKQIAGFRERILPLYPVTAILQFPFSNPVAVGKQVRVQRFVGNNFGGKARQDVRAIKIPGNVAETFGFTLGTQGYA